MSAPLNTASVVAAIGIASSFLALTLVVALGREKESLGSEVERSVQKGIERGVDSALAADRIQERSEAAGRGLVNGMIGGALDLADPGKATDAQATDPRNRAGARLARGMIREAEGVAEVGLDALEALLAVPPPQQDPRDLSSDSPPAAEDPLVGAQHAAPAPQDSEAVPDPREPSLAAVAGEAANLGFDLLDAFLAPQRATSEDGPEHESTSGDR